MLFCFVFNGPLHLLLLLLGFRRVVVRRDQEEYDSIVDGTHKKFGGEYLCPVCRDRAMAHMLGELQVSRRRERLGQ